MSKSEHCKLKLCIHKTSPNKDAICGSCKWAFVNTAWFDHKPSYYTPKENESSDTSTED